MKNAYMQEKFANPQHSLPSHARYLSMPKICKILDPLITLFTLYMVIPYFCHGTPVSNQPKKQSKTKQDQIGKSREARHHYYKM